MAPTFENFARSHPEGLRGKVLKYLLHENGTGVAPIFIIFNAGLTAMLVWLPYDALIEFSVLKFCFVTMLYLYAYLWYRVKKPDLVRPFKVPGGHVGAFLAVLPIAGMTMTTLYYGATSGDKVGGVPHAKVRVSRTR